MRRVYVTPSFGDEDKGEGGIRRVCEAQARYLPAYGYEVVDRLDGADLMHAHVTLPGEVRGDVPLIVSNHGLYWQEYEWATWAQKLNGQVVEAMRRADHVTACSEWVAQAIRRAMWSRPTVLAHGVDPGEWEGGANEGYLWWDKAYPHQVSDPAVVDELARRMPGARFVSTFGTAAANVRLTGRVPYAAAAALTRNAGVYLATARETFGISILQAMAAGVPVVGWRWGGAREIVQHGVTGWLAAPGDYEGLIEGVQWAQAHRAQVGEAARADVRERWTWERAIGRYAALYDQLLVGAEARKTTPRVSVVIPCYNLARFLPEALDSVLAQTVADWECIVVDDASTDGSWAIAQDYAVRDGRFRVLRNERNLHVAQTRNRGMREAAGRYLAALDADDRLAPNALALLADALDGDRGIGLAYGGLTVMSEAGELRDTPNEWPGAFDWRGQVEGRNQVPTFCLFRRELFERTGGYRARLSPCEDADLWTRIASIGGVPRKVTDAPTLLYRLRGDSISRTMPQREWAPWYPWSRTPALTPFAAAGSPPDGRSWPAQSYEPVRVSVVIPVGPGHERVVVDALDSVAAQTEQQWECIVVNDTGAPLPWAPSWAKVLDSPSPGSGPAVCRNLAIAASTAALFVPLDADDYLQPSALEAFVAAHRAHGGVVYSQWLDEHDGASAVYDPPAYDARLLTAKGCIHAVTACYSKADWLKVGGFDETLSHWEDWDFQLALAAAGVCGTKLAAPLWTYRKDRGLRREQNIATFEAGKAAILAKWDRYWTGGQELMACRTCGGTTVKPAAGSPQAPGSTDGLVKLEYLGPSAGSVSYRGASGASYRFANSDGHRVKYVKREDVGGLLALTGRFRLAAPEAEPALTMASPPSRPVPQPPAQRPDPAPVGAVAAPVGREPLKGNAPYWALRERLPGMTPEEVAVDLAAERARPAPRADLVKLLEAALRGEGGDGDALLA